MPNLTALFPVVAAVFCGLFALVLIWGSASERPTPAWPTLVSGIAFACFAGAAWCDIRSSGSGFTLLLMTGLALFVAAILLRLFPGGRLDTDYHQFNLQEIFECVVRRYFW